MTFETEGLGKADPVASNATPAGRTLNRRVEVFIKPMMTAMFEATAMPAVQPQRAEKAATPRAAEPAARPAPPSRPAPATQPAPPSRQAPGGGPTPNSPEMIAAVNRVKDVIARYAAALAARDEQALARVRPEITDTERTVLKAEQVEASIEVTTVQVSGTTATATCRRAIRASGPGKPVSSNGTAVIQLMRRPDGWIITEIR